MLEVKMLDLVRGFSDVVDMLNATLAGHHLRTAALTALLAGRLGLAPDEAGLAVIAAMLHDVGVIPLHDRIDDLVFEKNVARHSQAGYMMLATCPPLAGAAQVVLHHHDSWDKARALPPSEARSGRLGNLIHLADGLDIQSRVDSHGLGRLIHRGEGRAYAPEAAAAALELAASGQLAEALASPDGALAGGQAAGRVLRGEEVTEFARLFSHVIDSRTPFTATHSTGVAHLGLALHEMAGLPAEDRQDMFVAGLLHDIGKLGVPVDLIEKPGPLDDEEFKAVRRHAELSLKTLSAIPGFGKVAPWGALHHEKPNGRGYPGGLTAAELPTEARIMAVADVMTALTEDRPYRDGLDEGATVGILAKMAAEGALDGDLVALARAHYAQLDETRRQAQKAASAFFRRLGRDIEAGSAGL